VSSWNVHGAARQPATDVEITRPTDSDSPRPAKACTEGARSATATLLVHKHTPPGWIREMTVTLSDCWISSFVAQGEFDSVGLRFTRMEIEQ
jgi:type VI protein secretion system component Hcp